MAVLVAVGDRVSAGTTLVILEAMKMEHHISAPADGTVSDVHVTAGQQVENGAALLVLESEEPEEESA
jgi:biotin carboxyl carrier protein